MKPAQGADKNGPLAGVPYDGKLTKADGKGQWWDGLDPQDLYAQNHAPGDKAWNWELECRQRQQHARRGLHGEILQAHASSSGTITIPTRFISTTRCCRSTASPMRSG